MKLNRKNLRKMILKEMRSGWMGDKRGTWRAAPPESTIQKDEESQNAITFINNEVPRMYSWLLRNRYEHLRWDNSKNNHAFYKFQKYGDEIRRNLPGSSNYIFTNLHNPPSNTFIGHERYIAETLENLLNATKHILHIARSRHADGHHIAKEFAKKNKLGQLVSAISRVLWKPDGY